MTIGKVFRKGVRALGKMLVEAGLVGRNVVQAALEEQEQLRGSGGPHKPLGQILVEGEHISEIDLRRLLREQVDALLINPRREARDVWVLELYGYIDAYTHDVFEEALNSFLEEGKGRLVLDCTSLEYMNSDGIGPIVAARRRARLKGGDIKVTGLQGKAATVFEVLGMDQFVGVHDSIDEAIEAFSKPVPGQAEEQPSVRFVASAKGGSFHVEDCPRARKISRKNRVIYVSRDEALRAGKKPCSRCCGE